MQHHRYHHGVPAPTGVNATNYALHRGSPTVNRPPSSASTSSSSSYHMHSGPVPSSHTQDVNSKFHSHGHSMQMGSGPHQPMGSSGQGHNSAMHNMHAVRYPLPPRNGNGYIVQSIPGSQIPMRAQNGVALPTDAPPFHQHANANAHPLREQHDVVDASMHSQYGPPKSPTPSAMSRSVNAPPVHHPVPYRSYPGMRPLHGEHIPHYQHHQYHHQGYNHISRRSSYPPVTPHHHLGAREPNYPHYQRAMYESPETVGDIASFSRSPSPPPAPSFSHDKLREDPSHSSASLRTSSTGTVERRALGEAPLFKAIGSTSQHQWDGASVAKENAKPDSPSPSKRSTKDAVNEDDDAASILLQLSGVPSQSTGQELASGPDEERPVSTVHTENLGSFVPKSTANLLKPIEASSSIDDDATIATVEGTDYAPDLTSEPSADSIDQNDTDFPAPIPENYPTRLALKYDDRKLNSLHCFLRSELLEIFVVQKSSQKSPTHSPGSSVGRVGLRCVHCAMIQRSKENREEAPMAVFYPKSISEIYRLVTSWQRCHLRKCRNLPPAVRAKWQSLRDNDKSRGKTHYWITSAKEIGLIDCQSRAGGIRFGPNTRAREVSKDEPAPPAMETQQQTSDASNHSSVSTTLVSELSTVGLNPTETATNTESA